MFYGDDGPDSEAKDEELDAYVRGIVRVSGRYTFAIILLVLIAVFFVGVK